MDFKIMKCPVCGSPLDAGPDEKFIICRACDTPLRLNEDATSFLRDPEAFGYGFEKGRQRARAEEEQRRSIERGSFYDQSVPNQPYPGQVNYNYYGANPGVSDKDRMTTLIICVLLGLVGGHQFYVGKIGKGVLYLFTGGLFGIGWIIDIISLATGSFKDSNGRVLVSESERSNRQYGNQFGGMPQRNNGGAPQQAYRGQPGYGQPDNSQVDYSQPGYGQPEYNDDELWARKMRNRRHIFLALIILFGLTMIGNLSDGNFSGFLMTAILTGLFGYLYYKTPKT